MKTKLLFNTKSTSAKISEAINISKSLNGKILDSFMHVDVEEHNKDFIKLLNLVGTLGKTTLSIDKEEVTDIRKYVETVSCKRIKSCKGNCISDYNRWNSVFMPLDIIENWDEQMVSLDISEHTFNHHKYNMVKEIHPDYLILDRDMILKAFQSDFEVPKKYCPKYNDIDIISRIKNLPEEIEVKSGRRDDYNSQDSINLDTLIKQRQDDQNKSDEQLINKVADEFEKRMRTVLDEYFNKNQSK